MKIGNALGVAKCFPLTIRGFRVSLFADGLKKLRERRGVSARALSLEAGLSASYVSKIESGQVKPSVEAFAYLMKALEASDEEVLYMVRFCL